MKSGLPFDLKQHNYNALTEKTIEKANKGEDVYGPFDSIDELMEELNA